MRYPIAKHGIFRTVQGEGSLLGVPMAFVRLAGCSIGCSQCDTDYTVHERLTAAEIGNRVRQFNMKWTWITGGEPADHDLWPLLEELRLCGRVALATSGMRCLAGAGRLVDFISLSPHGKPKDMVAQAFQGAQFNLVPGLGGLSLSDWLLFDTSHFCACYVTPCDGKPETITECLDFMAKRQEFRLGVQAHKLWGLP